MIFKLIFISSAINFDDEITLLILLRIFKLYFRCQEKTRLSQKLILVFEFLNIDRGETIFSVQRNTAPLCLTLKIYKG